MPTKVQILGTGCPKCKALTANAEAAIKELGLDAEIEKVEQIKDIMAMGVMMTPALAVDGVVKGSGRVLTVDQVKVALAGAASA
jgi:small redox-active disulfide protein 2